MRRSSLTISGIFHATVFLIAAFGLPYAHREFVIPPPIVVDFIDISKVTQTDRVTPQPVQPPEKPEPKKEDPPPSPPVAQNTAAAPAAPIKEVTPPEVKKETKPKKAETVDENALPDKNKKPPKKEEAKAEP